MVVSALVIMAYASIGYTYETYAFYGCGRHMRVVLLGNWYNMEIRA